MKWRRNSELERVSRRTIPRLRSKSRARDDNGNSLTNSGEHDFAEATGIVSIQTLFKEQAKLGEEYRGGSSGASKRQGECGRRLLRSRRDLGVVLSASPMSTLVRSQHLVPRSRSGNRSRSAPQRDAIAARSWSLPMISS